MKILLIYIIQQIWLLVTKFLVKYLNYKKEHVHEILKSDAMKRKSDDKIDEFIEENLTKMDIFLEWKEIKNDKL